MRKFILVILIFSFSQINAQSVFGYWYGYANVKTASSANNYLVELILQPERGQVKGILNYYFKNTYRSLQVKGTYIPSTRQLKLMDIPIVYHGSLSNFEVDCIMNLIATMRISRVETNLVGSFYSLPEYKYTCGEIRLNLAHDSDLSQKKDSVLRAISEYKENYQVWTPSATDTTVAVSVVPRKVINYVTETEFTKRKSEVIQEIEVESDTIRVDVYDNGEIDGDMISVFFNQQLILYNQKLTHKSILLTLALDQSKDYNDISMFAENLGLIPPNTALMRIYDGRKQLDVRVSSSLDKNAVIRIKKKKN